MSSGLAAGATSGWCERGQEGGGEGLGTDLRRCGEAKATICLSLSHSPMAAHAIFIQIKAAACRCRWAPFHFKVKAAPEI